MSAVRASFKAGTVDLSIRGMKFKVGNVFYNRAKCTKVFVIGKKQCISTPNTYQPYIRFKVLQSQVSPPPTTEGSSAPRLSYSDLRLQTRTALYPTDNNFELGVLPNSNVLTPNGYEYIEKLQKADQIIGYRSSAS